MIWIASATSCSVLHLRGELKTWFMISIGGAATVGSVVFWRMFPGGKCAVVIL